MNKTLPFSAVLLGAAASLLALAPACNRDQPVPSAALAAPAPSPAAAPAAAARMNPAGDPAVPMPPKPTGQDAIAWKLPSGWNEARGEGMRFATLKPSGAGKVEVSVIMLPGPAGGELGNVNRWRGQIALPPIDEASRVRMRQEVASKAGTISLYDFAAEGANAQRMLAGLLFVRERSWFFKMLGDKPATEAARPAFLDLLRSLHFPDGK